MSNNKKPPRKRIKSLQQTPRIILIQPDRPDIYAKGGFEVEYTIGKSTYTEKTSVNDAGELELAHFNKKTGKRVSQTTGKQSGHIVSIHADKINLFKIYHAEGESEFYSASFFGGVIHTQLIPTMYLPEFLEEQIAIDDEAGKFYDLINIRENGRDMWGQGVQYKGEQFRDMSESAEELLLKLNQYKRHGSLIGAGGSFQYIQVCYIILA